MRQFEAIGVQGLPWTDGKASVDELVVIGGFEATEDLVTPVAGIVEEGVSSVGHVDADLVHAASVEGTL